MQTLLLLLAGCGGQSGENGKGGDLGSCDLVSSEPLADVAEADWPSGTAAVVDAYAALDGAWIATLRCLDEPDAPASLTLTVDDTLMLDTYEGNACSAPAVGLSGVTDYALWTDTFEDAQALPTQMQPDSDAAYPILMTGDGVELAWSLDGRLDSAIDTVRTQGENTSSDATCSLIDLSKDGE